MTHILLLQNDKAKNNAESKYICNCLSSLTLSTEVNKNVLEGFLWPLFKF